MARQGKRPDDINENSVKWCSVVGWARILRKSARHAQLLIASIQHALDDKAKYQADDMCGIGN